MSTAALYTVILILYFSALMGLGFWFNRRNRSRQEYFLARGDLGPATLGFSYSATQMSGSSYMGAVGTERELGTTSPRRAFPRRRPRGSRTSCWANGCAGSRRGSGARRSWTFSRPATRARRWA